MTSRDRIVTEAARLRRQHGYTWREAFAMAELCEIFATAGITLVAADDLPNISIGGVHCAH